MKYNAFLSYSHAADDALAPSLQSALHRFARPWNRMRALRVFRDKTSLAASPELWPAIVTALDESEFFLLLASPAAAASHWVRREVDWWRENRTSQKMLILLTDGDLFWNEAGGDFDWNRTNALPPSLSGLFTTEPLWVDLRWARSGEVLDLRHAAFRLAVLDIATPLHGRSKDELDGDDVRQFARTRRLAATAVTALVVLTISSVAAAIFAVRQRNEALRQSATAQAGRLAAQSDLLRERNGPADDSALLAAEGLRLLQSIGDRSLEVDLSLRRALALLPRALGAFELFSGTTMEIAPDGHHVTLSAVADQVSVRELPGGQLRGCRWTEINDQLAVKGLPKSVLIRATSSSGSHCATIDQMSTAPKFIDIWSAVPLARIASVAHAVDGHVRLALSDEAEFLAITDQAQTGQPDAGSFRVWSRTRGADVLQQTGAEFMAFGPDRKKFSASKGVWRLPEMAETAAVQLVVWTRSPWSSAFSRSGQRIATRIDYDGEVEVWDLGIRKPAPSTRPPAGKLLALSDDGRFILLDGASGTLLWDIEQGVERARVPTEGLAAAFGELATIVLTDEPDSTQTRTALVLGLEPSGAALFGADAAAGEHVLWLGFSGQRLHGLVDAGKTMRIDTWSSTGAEAGPVVRKDIQDDAPWAVSLDGSRIAIAHPGGVVIHAIDGGRTIKELVMTPTTQMLAFSARGEILATATRDAVQVWKTDSGEHWSSAPARGEVSSLRVSDDGDYAMAIVAAPGAATRAGVAYELLRWRVADGAQPTTLALGRQLHPPDLGCLVSGDGSSLFAGGQRLDITAAAAASAPPQITASGVACVSIPGGALRAAIDDKNLVVTDPQHGQTIARLEHSATVQLAALSADGRRVATLDKGGSVRVWALDPADLIAQVCARAPRELSVEAWKRYMPAAATTDACGRKRKGEAQRR